MNGTEKAKEVAPSSQPAAGFKRMEIVEADSEEEEEAVKGKEEVSAKAAPRPPPEPPAGFKRMEIVEADEESEDEVEAAPVPKPKEAEPFADIRVEHTVSGLEQAKDTGNKLFQEGKLAESDRWFSKAIWLAEESGKVTAPDTLRGVLHSNRAFARLKLEQWSSAETDCSKALELNSKNAKALYRRAMARKELRKFQPALDDLNQLLPMLDAPQKAAAQKLKDDLVSELNTGVNGVNGSVAKETAVKETAPTSPPAGFKRMQIVEDSESEDEAPSKPKEEPRSTTVPVVQKPQEPFADIQVEHSVAGVQKAKDKGNELFQAGKIEESARWFSKAIWLVESGKVTGAGDSLTGILHSNRAFARLQLQQWSEAASDCDEALKLDQKNPKALYRRALARKELKRFEDALVDVKQLLPMLESQNNGAALKLKEELESKVPAVNGTEKASVHDGAENKASLFKKHLCGVYSAMSSRESIEKAWDPDSFESIHDLEAMIKAPLEEKSSGLSNKSTGSTASPPEVKDVSGAIVDDASSVEKRQEMVQSSQHEWFSYKLAHKVAWVVQILFTLASLLLLALWIRHVHPEAYVVTFFVTSIAAAAYFAKVTGMSDVVIAGRKVPLIRYIDWIATTPLMLFELCVIGGAEKSTTIFIIGCDLIMLGGGIVSATVVPKAKVKLKYAWFMVSNLFFILMIAALQVDVAQGTVKTRPEDVQQLFSRLEWLTIVSWTGYPIVVFLGRAHAGLISKGVEDALLCMLDCIAKLGMEGFLIASCSAEGAECHAK
eukprot:symbB.v1.2.000186.t2/scaffold21.1/size436794/5